MFYVLTWILWYICYHNFAICYFVAIIFVLVDGSYYGDYCSHLHIGRPRERLDWWRQELSDCLTSCSAGT